MQTTTCATQAIPAAAGIGLRGQHHTRFLALRPAVAWVEVHSENFFAPHGVAAKTLERVREDYPVSLHGVGLSLASTDPLDRTHLARLRELAARIEPGLVSEHLSWGSVGGKHLNDLLPVPHSEEALAHVIERIDAVQEALERQILIENVSSYLAYEASTLAEWEFIAEAARRSGCRILLDINNIYVSARNHGFDPTAYLEGIPRELVGEMHLAGHSVQRYGTHEILVDTHDDFVCDEVWTLYRSALRRFGRVPTLIEWDSNLPMLELLLAEALKAQHVLEQADELAA